MPDAMNQHAMTIDRIAAMVRSSPGGGEINPRSWPTEWNAEKQT